MQSETDSKIFPRLLISAKFGKYVSIDVKLKIRPPFAKVIFIHKGSKKSYDRNEKAESFIFLLWLSKKIILSRFKILDQRKDKVGT